MTSIEIGLAIAALSLGGITLGQLPGVTEATKLGTTLGEMSAVAILGTVAVLSLACVAYLIRVMMTKLLTALGESTAASQRQSDTNQRLAEVITKCEVKR